MPSLKRRFKEGSKTALRKLFERGQRFGLAVLPRHFYSEIPDIRKLRTSPHWKAPYSMLGVRGMGIQRQLDFVRDCCTPPIFGEIRTKDILARASARGGEEGFGPVEATLLYAFLATKRPNQIFQIGCGVSTAVCLLAAEYVGYTPDGIYVEPYPTDYLVERSQEWPNRSHPSRSRAVGLGAG